MQYRPILIYALIVTNYQCPVIAQSPSLGNGSAIAPSAGQLEDYGIRAPVQSQSSSGFATRHFRRGRRTGIGGSFLDTTQVTSETSPATKEPSANPGSRIHMRNPSIKAPNLEDTLARDNLTSPALETLDLDKQSNSTALSNPLITPPSFSSINIENLPSFNKQPSLMQKVQFNTFGSSDKLGF